MLIVCTFWLSARQISGAKKKKKNVQQMEDVHSLLEIRPQLQNIDPEQMEYPQSHQVSSSKNCHLLLMEEILHLSIGCLFHFLQGFIHVYTLGGVGYLPSTVSWQALSCQKNKK